MAGTKIKHNQDLRKSPTKKTKYPVEHMKAPAVQADPNNVFYFNHASREKTWMTEQKIEHLGVELLQWAETPEATKLSKFFHARRITNQMALEWCKKWPTFAADYQLAKEIIGDRREDGALSKVFDAHFIRVSMPMYDEEWKRESERVAKLTKDEQQLKGTGVINVIMERFIPDDKPIEEDKNKKQEPLAKVEEDDA